MNLLFKRTSSVLFLSLVSHAFFSDPVKADSNNSLATVGASSSEASSSFYPWAIYGGIGTGYGLVSGPGYSTSPNGGDFLINATLSYQIIHWVFDAGIGWMYSNFSGKNTSGQSVQIITRAGLLDLSPRYKLSQHWQLGPVANLAFGTDTTFQSFVGDSAGSLFMGLKGVYEISELKFPLRFWAQVSTDLQRLNQQAYLILGGVQIGLPFPRSSSSTFVAKEEAMPAHQREGQSVHVVLDSQKVFFASNSAAVKEEIKKALEDIASYLNTNEKLSTIKISGHADQRGSFKHNLKLSQRRANAVQDAFLSGSLDPDKLSVQAFSFLRPLDPKNSIDAWAKNRRVEIIFNQIEKPGPLVEKLKPLILPNTESDPRATLQKKKNSNNS